MSIVERAIKRLQESRSIPNAPVTIGTGTPRMIPLGAAPALGGIDQVEPLERAYAPAVARASAAPGKIIAVDRSALRSVGLLPPEHQERQLADEYRQIKRPLIAKALGKGVERLPGGHLIMMASAIAGEGKTFTCINLALSMSREKDLSVLLVDADVPKPHISRLFGVMDAPGLLDVLSNPKLDVESVILPTDVPHLSILPIGRQTDTATELLASGRMEETVAAIGARDPRRIVLFDSPPLLLTSESRALAQIVGQIVIVVRAGKTSQQAIQDALALLGTGKSVGLVLNQCEYGESATYGYGYGYGSYRAQETNSD